MQSLRDKLMKAGVVKPEAANRVAEKQAAVERARMAQVDAPQVDLVDLHARVSGSPEIGPILDGEAPLTKLRDRYLLRTSQGQPLSPLEDATLWGAHFLEVGLDQWLNYERLFEPARTVVALELFGFSEEAKSLAAVVQLLASTGRDLADVDERYEALQECPELWPTKAPVDALFGRSRHGGAAELRMLAKLREWSSQLS